MFCADVTGIETAVVNAVARVEGRSDDAQKEKTWLDQNKIETRDAKSVGPFMKRSDAGVLAQAAGLLTWQRTVRFCAECGSRTALIKAGHKTICRDDTETKCKGVNYPKLMPAVLTLTTCGDFCLLGRNSKWPPGFYSCLAGFVDQSESLEQAVSREVAEESGISVQHERTAFVTSQPWPFPNQLMVGFRAECLEKTILLTSNSRSGDKTSRPSVTKFSYPPSPNLDRNELKDARWFHRDWLREQVRPWAFPKSQHCGGPITGDCLLIHAVRKTDPFRGTQSQLGKHGDPRETSKEIPVGSIALPGTHALARRLVEQWVMEDGGGYRGNTSGKKIPVVAFTGGSLPVSTLPPTNRSHAFVACEFLGKGGGSVTALRFQPTGGEGAPTKNDHERLAKECEKEASRWVGGLGVGSASGNTLGGGNTTQMDSNHWKAVRFLGGGQICFRGGEVSESAAYDDERYVFPNHHVPPLRLPIRDFGTDTFFFIGPGKRFWSRWCGTGGAGSTGGSPFRPPTKK